MSRTAQQRYDETIKYLKSVSATLGNEVDRLILNKLTAGQEISLEGAGYWRSGSDEQHAAVRSYLLCMLAYGRPPYALNVMATKQKLDEARRSSRALSVQQVKNQIALFLPTVGATRLDLARAAREAQELTGPDDELTRTRTDRNIGTANPICYNGVKIWLFLAGFVSRRWLIKEGPRLDANTCNRLLGDGQVLAQSAWGSIPEGYFWNIHKQGDKTTCHWGVSLGNDTAAACNNSPGTVKDGETVILQFSSGNASCGVCTFTELCDICDNDVKYRPAGGGTHASGTNIVVRQIDPMAATGFY